MGGQRRRRITEKGKERKYLEKENKFSAEEKKNGEGGHFLEKEFFADIRLILRSSLFCHQKSDAL